MLFENNQLNADDQNTQEHGLTDVMKLAIIGTLGYTAYRSGILKDIMKPMMEVADTLAREGGDRAGLAMHTIKEWSRLKHLTPGQIKASQDMVWSAAENSIFRRNRSSSLGYDILQDFKNSVESGRIDFYNVRKLIQGSSEDMVTLQSMLKYNMSRIDDIRTNYTNTELYTHLRNFNDFIKVGKTEFEKDNLGKHMMSFQSKYTEEFVKAMTLTEEMAQTELKRTGYRPLTIGDVAEMGSDKILHIKADAPIDITHARNKRGINLLDEINQNFSDTFNRINGQPMFKGDNWKNIMIDPGLRIAEDGRVVDYRMTRDNAIGFIRSLSNDFGLPQVGFNPLRTIGLDKVGRKPIFAGFLSPDQIDPSITGRTGNVTIGQFLSDTYGREFANSPVAIINGKGYIAKELGAGSELIELNGTFKLHDITNADSTFGLKPKVNLERQMANLDTGNALYTRAMEDAGFHLNPRASIKDQIDQYNQWLTSNGLPEMTSFQKNKFAVGRFFDIGTQEIRNLGDEAEFLSLDNATNIDEFINNKIQKLTKFKGIQVNGFEYSTVDEMLENSRRLDYKKVFGEGFNETDFSGNYRPRMYYAQKAGKTFQSTYDALKEKDFSKAASEFKDYAAQYFSGRDFANPEYMGKHFTERSTFLYGILNQLSEGLGNASHLFGLSTEAKGSAATIFGNLLLKRFLPVYMLTQVPGVINGLSEIFMGKDPETGQNDNISRWLMRGPVKRFDLAAHSVLDITGATSVFKELGELTPGSDQINATVPFVYAMGLGQTHEEREDYIENGYDPIRKGRYWGSGNTPWTGGKIMYWRPNLYRRVEADVMFSDSKWGSRQEYYNNTWFPNPLNPLAPLNHFVFDRHHYDKKHYYDRPYLQTSPEGERIPIIGPIFSQTVGRVIMPPKKMHLEYWQNGLQPIPGDEAPSTLITEGQLYAAAPKAPRRYFGTQNDVQTFQVINQQVAATNREFVNNMQINAYQAKQMTSRTIQDNSGITFTERSILPLRTYDRYDTPYEVYSTPSGGLTVVDVPDELNLYNVNQDLKRWSINKIIGTNKRVSVIDEFHGPGIPAGNDSALYDNEFITSGIGEQYNTLADVAGLKGFMFTQAVGDANVNARQVEGSGYAYSMTNRFWDQELGGFGGNLSEISRRFIQDRTKSIEYINPIRNTMPNWMPGSNYFTDFKHGDPYTKVPNGEMRLPGEGYERLHHITGLTDFKIGSSYLGYSQADIVKHLIGQEGYQSGFELDTLNKGTDIHKQIEKQWEDNGFAISTEGRIEDKRNGILGFYDAMIHDPTSRTGVGIVDIKTTSAKKLDEIRKSGQPLDHHRKQVNYYLWATQNEKSKGYVYYVDKENLDNFYMVGFDYSQDLLKESLNNLYGARQTVQEALNKGIIGRGDLYSEMDRFRILADVAPYSQEFADASATISGMKLTPEEQKEASAIRQRVKEQKEPLRVYDYKFKTANLKSETVTIDRVIDNNTIVTKEYGKQHSIKFAGIRVSESNSDMYDENRTMNDAARDALRKNGIKRGAKITISYDADEHNKFKTDSTRSIRAVVTSRGRNVNQYMMNTGLAKENENDNSPAGINARYTKGEIAFGSAMERLTHQFGQLPFVNKVLQVRSPYEQYRYREVYSKDFQSWNHPIRDMLIPNADTHIANTSFGHIGGIVAGAYIGSLFGKNNFGRIVGAFIGGSTTAVGKLAWAAGTDKDRDWRPKRRREQENVNEYMDVLKYVKATRLYEKYKAKAKREDHYDLDKFVGSKEYQGSQNKARQRELNDYKRTVKLDFKHRDRYDFKYGKPKYATLDMDKKATVRGINAELAELQSQRKVTKMPKNALIALEYKQMAEQTMYGYEPGDNLTNIMVALPKKERQYFKHFMNAPEEEKEKILRIAPSYLRRALQSTWGMPVDRKPSLQEYFQHHALPDASWIGWDESTNLDDVKVKLVHDNKLDPGEFDIWDNNKAQADAVNIPVPNINATNNPREVQAKLQSILGRAGYQDVQVHFRQSLNNRTDFNIRRDARGDIYDQMAALEA